MASAFVSASPISIASAVDALGVLPSASYSLISSRGSRVPPVPRAPSACLARLPHSLSSDSRIQRGTAAAVSATPIATSPSGEKAQSSAARKLSISREIGQPLICGPRRRFTFRAFEKTAIVLGVAAGESFALAARTNLLDRVGAGRVEQPEPRFGAADIRDKQRFGHQIGQA